MGRAGWLRHPIQLLVDRRYRPEYLRRRRQGGTGVAGHPGQSRCQLCPGDRTDVGYGYEGVGRGRACVASACPWSNISEHGGELDHTRKRISR